MREELVGKDEQHGRALIQAWHAGVVCIGAAAAAIEALYNELATRLRKPTSGPPAGSNEGARLAASFIAGRDPGLMRASRWTPELVWLFDLRNKSMHFRPQARTPLPHIMIPTNVAQEQVGFSIRSAKRAVDLSPTFAIDSPRLRETELLLPSPRVDLPLVHRCPIVDAAAAEPTAQPTIAAERPGWPQSSRALGRRPHTRGDALRGVVTRRVSVPLTSPRVAPLDLVSSSRNLPTAVPGASSLTAVLSRRRPSLCAAVTRRARHAVGVT